MTRIFIMQNRDRRFGDSSVPPELLFLTNQQCANKQATLPPAKLPTYLTFSHVRRACELAIKHGQHKIAWRGSQALLQRCPDSLWAYMIMAQSLLEGKHSSLSIQYFQMLIKRNSMDAVAWRGLSHALKINGHDAASAAASRRATCNQPLDSNGLPSESASALHSARGMIYWRRGLAEMAYVELANALQKAPTRNDIRWAYISSLWQTQRFDEARRLLSHHDMELEPEFPLLCLRALCSPSAEVFAATREMITAMDPDGTFQHAFFAPFDVPWELDASIMLRWNADLQALSEHLIATQQNLEQDIAFNRPMANTMRHAVTQSKKQQPYASASTGLDFDGQVHVILGNRSALIRRFGSRTFTQIDTHISNLTDVLRTKGMSVVAGYVDDMTGFASYGYTQTTNLRVDAFAIRDFLRDFAAKLASDSRELTTVEIGRAHV